MKEKLRGIKAIAHEAGVAISTVSCVLNNTGRISVETRERILQIAKELNYEPSFVAQSLKRKRTRVVGLFISNEVSEFYSKLIRGINEGLSSEGYEFVVCHGAKAQRFLGEGFLDGVIVFDSIIGEREITQVASAGKPVLLLDRTISAKGVSTLLLDNMKGVADAMAHLVEQGHQEIHCVTGSLNQFYMEERMRAVRHFLQEHQSVVVHWHTSSLEEQSGYRVAKSIYVRAFRRPLVFFVFNDQTALGIYDYARRNDLEVGKDIIIVGCDGLSIGRYLYPHLSSVAFDIDLWGRRSASIMINQLLQIDSSPVRELFPMKLIVGASSLREDLTQRMRV
ncbi:LacI family DNA-binding transcriptional regulator [Entomospira culicis]|uniref:LacI family transcriptional regulator n=1 Tax=Entomospira culicis TaxID=2719989 RepID=A0A968KWD9_9SPIO|nr:LacI family DNA-binding transcriptional regulator [Entomospira culicis]NIZ18882.1 LacI family transcriptional regulator [Entomospira culicis]NIZ69097.1 LacI family transcriptional regulator [Entomospira culicis]WDI37684.1 LacI family DNA-binding transcriptional regulator [Entomospira culicis]WDI39312.1 LacI family DNA-binding transcriptional regulator [Entomospira culicis]